MGSALPIIALLVIAAVSFLVIRIGARALVMTGLAEDSANFQATSAFFGVGFTTAEAELVVNHPVRRRIVTHLIIGGNIGLTSALATIVISFVNATSQTQSVATLGFILAGLLSLYVLLRITFVRGAVDAVIKRTVEMTGGVVALDYALLLRVRAGYQISEIELQGQHPLIGHTIAESRLADHGVLVLSVTRTDGTFVGTPSGKTSIEQNDSLTVYGKEDDIVRLLKEKEHPTVRKPSNTEGTA